MLKYIFLKLLVFIVIFGCVYGHASISQKVVYEAKNAHSTHNIDHHSDHVTLKATRGGSLEDQGHIIFTVFVDEDASYPVVINFKHEGVQGRAAKSLISIQANGLATTKEMLAGVYTNKQGDDNWQGMLTNVDLRQGLNTIILQNADSYYDVSVESIIVYGATKQADRGATTPYFELEAEDASTNAGIIGPDRTYHTLASEASGRRAVQLNAQGHYVEFTLTGSANAIVVRLSIPDTQDGQGQSGLLGVYVNDKNLVNISVTSRYSWVYGGYPFSNNPNDGLPHHFYDDARALFGQTLQAGTKVKLQGLSPFTFTIDLADFYTAPAPYTQPANYLSVTTYGADPSGSRDSTDAIRKAIDDGVQQSKGVWIPQGTFLVSSQFTVNKVTVRGAGPWYSVVKASRVAGVGFFGNGAPTNSQNVGLYDFAMLGETIARDDGSVDSGIGGAFDANSIIQNLWMEHMKVGIWVDGPFQGLHITGVTIRNTFADGVNFHSGLNNVVLEQSVIRNTGDDCLAMYSQSAANKANTFKFNTAQAPLLANTAAVYGGGDNSITDSIFSDSITEGACLQASNRFGAVPLSGTTTFARNTLLRCGALNSYTSGRNGALWFWGENGPISGGDKLVVVTDIEVVEPSYTVVSFWGLTTLEGFYFSNIHIDKTPYVVSVWGTSGSAYMEYVVADSVNTTGVCSCMGGKFNIQFGPGNSGWTSSTQCVSTC